MIDDNRKTASEHLKEYNKLNLSLESLEARIRVRLTELAKANPEAIILRMARTDIKAVTVTPEWIKTLSVVGQIEYIDTIERYVDTIQRGRQTSILD